MHVDITGHGPPLVMIHGWAMHSGIFAPLIERLCGEFTLYLVDLPGHGRSTPRTELLVLRDFARDALDRLPPAPWLGWSLGGMLAIEAARQRPDRVPALIALCASPRFVSADDWPHAVDAEVLHSFGLELKRDQGATIDRFMTLEAQGSAHMREELRELRTRVFDHGQPAAQALEDGLHILAHDDLRPVLADLRIPSLWIAGRHDCLVPWRAVRSAASLLPNAQFQRIEGSGHAPFLSHAGEVAAVVSAFLSKGLLKNDRPGRFSSRDTG